MRKKLLDIAWLMLLLLSLTAISNLQEEEKLPEPVKTERAESGNSEASFTPESNEKTVVTKKDIIRVESPCETESAEKTETDIPAEDSGETETAGAETESCKNRWNITLTQEEIDLLARIVWLEAQGEPVEGQQAVVEVVFNRMASELYPDTLYEVLSQNNPVQFCSWKNRDRAVPTEKEYQSIEDVLTGKTAILRNDTMYFSTFPLTENVECKIGGHYFCY